MFPWPSSSDGEPPSLLDSCPIPLTQQQRQLGQLGEDQWQDQHKLLGRKQQAEQTSWFWKPQLQKQRRKQP